MHRGSWASYPTSPSGPCDTGVTKVQVTGLHSDLADEDLEAYFETPRSGGRKGSVIWCSVEEGGTAYIEFDSPEVAANVVSKETHDIAGKNFTVRLHLPREHATILVSTPPDVDLELLQLRIEKQIGPGFSIEAHSCDSYLVTIAEQLSGEELKNIMEKLRTIKIASKPLGVQYYSADLNESMVGSHESEPSEEEQYPGEYDSSAEGESIRLCHASLLLSNLPPAKEGYVQCHYEQLLNMSHEDDFDLKEQGDSNAVMTFKKCLSQEELDAILTNINGSKMRNCDIDCKVINMCGHIPTMPPKEILVTGIPSDCDIGYVEAYLENAIKMKNETDFTLTQHSKGSLLIILKKTCKMQEFHRIIRSIKEGKFKKVSLMAEAHWTLPEGVPRPAPDSGPSQIVISSIPKNMSVGHLDYFFENECAMQEGSYYLELQKDGTALMTLTANDLKKEDVMKIVAAINTKRFRGTILKAEWVNSSSVAPSKTSVELPKTDQVAKITEEKSHLLITLPDSSVEIKTLENILEAATSMERKKDFILDKLSDDVMTVNFQNHMTKDDLCRMITEIEKKKVKGQFLKAKISTCQPVIRVKNFSGDFDEDFMRGYFENTRRSGGGEIESVELVGLREAVVKFCDPNVIECVLEKSHAEDLGSDVIVMRDWLSDSIVNPTDKNMRHLISIPVSPSLRDVIRNDLIMLQGMVADLAVQVTMDEGGAIVLLPSHVTRDGWESHCRDRVNEYIKSNFAEASLDISQMALSMLLPTIMEMQKSERSFSYTPPIQGQGTPLHFFVGNPNAIQKIKTDLEAINASITVITTQLDLDEMKFAYLFQLKQNDISLAYPNVDVQYNCPRTVTLQGTVQDIDQLKSSLSADYAYNTTMVDLKNQQLFEFLRSDTGQKELKRFIGKSFHCSAAVYVAKSGGNMCSLYLLSEPKFQQLVKKAADIIPAELCSRSIPIDALYSHFHSDENDIADYDDLCHQHSDVHIKTTDEEVQITGFKHAVDNCLLSLKAFINKKCEVTKMVEVELGIWRLFQGTMCMQWNSIADVKLADAEVNIQPQLSGDKCVIQLSGRVDAVECILEKIVTLEKSIVVKLVPLARPDIREYMKGEMVRAAIRGIEADHKVCIEISEDMALSDDVVECNPKVGGYREVLVAYTKELKKVIVCVGDITEFNRADVLVNAANGELQHVGGVAKAFLERGGPIIQDSSTKYCKTNGRLLDGDVWLTTDIGHLPCKALVHAVGPKWNSVAKSDRSLFSAFFKSLKSASAKAYKSIAFPAISTGVYGFPYDICAQCWVEAVVKFIKAEASSPLSEIYFVANDDAGAAHVVTAMKSQPSDVFTINSPGSTSSLHTHSTSLKRGTTLNVDYLKLHKGDLLDVKADVYVNTSNEQLNLAMGTISAIIAKAAGPRLQQECSQKAPIKPGDVAVTTAGDLKCKNVFHTVLCSYDGPGGKAEKVLQQAMQNCLFECSRLNISSIAFPALGTGALGFPADVSAELMITTAVDFMNNKCSLKTIHIVVYQDSMLSTFQTALSRPHQPSGAKTKGMHMGKRIKSKTSSVKPSATSVPGTYTFDSLNVNIIQGDITDESSDAIVNSTSRDMKLVQTGVCGALLRKAPGLQSDCDAYIAQHQELKSGKVASTPARGNLKCKTIFHVNYDPTSDSLPEAICACLTKAEELRYSTISFPAIGTGNHQCSPDSTAKKMLEGIKRFVTARNSHNLKTIRIVIYQAEIHKPFLDVFSNPAPTSEAWYKRWCPRSVGQYLFRRTEESDEDVELDHLDNNFITTSICLNIYGETNESVSAAEKKAFVIIDKNFEAVVIDNALIDEIPKSDLKALMKFSEENGVQLSIDRAPLNQIKLYGETQKCSKVRSQVQDVLHSYQERAQVLEKAEMLQMTVEWQRRSSDGTYHAYETLVNYNIENEFQLDKKEYVHQDKQDRFKINFEKNEEVDVHGTVTLVKRIDKTIEGCPSHWDPMPVDQANKEVMCHIVDIASSCQEYKDVIDAFSKTMVQGINYNKVLKVQRIQNPTLYGQYIIRKRTMEKQNPHCQNERKLFHGTKVDISEKINVQGFNRSFSGRNATVYGLGTYFARDALYSAQDKYSTPNANGHKYMYLAGVLTGEYTLGKQNMIIPPAKDPTKDPNLVFESVVENISNPSIFVVFTDAQAYPEYLIIFC